MSSAMVFMSLYVYCLSEETAGAAALPAVGVAGARPYLISFGDVAAVVSEFEGARVEVTRENVLAHDTVVRALLAETTPLPFRFGTLAGEARLRGYVEARRAELKAQLGRVRGCVEMSVKVLAVLEDAVGGPEGGPHAVAETSGTAFLMAKRREVLADELSRGRAAEAASWLAERLAGSVRESQVALRPKGALALAAAHLVERARLEEYRVALARARAERTDLHFLTSGPWPPYSFTSARS